VITILEIPTISSQSVLQELDLTLGVLRSIPESKRMKHWNIMENSKFVVDPGVHTRWITDQMSSLYGVNSCSVRLLAPFSGYHVHQDDHRWEPINYHSVLQSAPGNYFIYPEFTGAQQIWPLDQRDCVYSCVTDQPHSFVNLSDVPRIHITWETRY